MNEQDISSQLQERVITARSNGAALSICGGNTKSFYGRHPAGEVFDVSANQGVINYAPTELVITARAGTPLKVIEETLDEQNQMLAFEPPHYGDNATLGGMIACNLSGPRRPYAGAARDFMLGCKLLNGKGEILSFGGEVMKNVAGYDVSRLMTGAMGTLGILLEISLKVLPKPETELTLVLPATDKVALDKMHQWARQPLPVTATCYDGGDLYIRLSGASGAVSSARKIVGGDEVPAEKSFWHKIREQQHAFFSTQHPLWRLSLASNTPPLDIDGKWLYEWGGALRWLISEVPAEEIRKAVSNANGHATYFRGAERIDNVFQALPGGLMKIHHNLKKAFDPDGILNPGRMYAEL
ncbi:MAG: glycolate oxidase subunit GlcE [Gammaproteobacteria bacterium]|nr:MAG: glycolate oxidase subunit GlcE [Gammaproteobacteria bacterium]